MNRDIELELKSCSKIGPTTNYNKIEMIIKKKKIRSNRFPDNIVMIAILNMPINLLASP